MVNNTSVVICCAGMGTRLGIGTTKALMCIQGKPLILHILDALKEYDDIRIVLGYQAERVIEVVNQYRKDIMYSFNYDYKTNGPATSLCKGMFKSKEYVLYIEGDILVNPDDFKVLLKNKNEYLAISEKHSNEPVLVDVIDGQAIRFSSQGNFEWTGIARLRAERIKTNQIYTYKLIEKLLPLSTVLVRSRDIDTSEDYENAIAWVQNGYKE